MTDFTLCDMVSSLVVKIINFRHSFLLSFKYLKKLRKNCYAWDNSMQYKIVCYVSYFDILALRR